MKDITKDNLIELGFTEDIGYNSDNLRERNDNDKFYYYEYNVNEYCMLISDGSDENDGNFTIEFFDFYGVQITTYVDLVDLIRIMKRNTINS